MILVQLSDFTADTAGVYSLASSNGLDDIIQAYIDREEKPTLYKLLGKPLADLLINYIALTKTDQTVGPLVVGTSYYIGSYVAGDDFTNVGGTNTQGTYFIATGTTPSVWTNASSLVSNRVQRYDDILDPFYIEGDNGFTQCQDQFFESYGIKDILLIQIYYQFISKEQTFSSQSGIATNSVENGTVATARQAQRKGEIKWNTDGVKSWDAIRYFCKDKYPSVYPEFNGVILRVKYSSII